MVSNGKISGKRCFERATVGDKVVLYISNFQLGQEGFILSLMEDLNSQVTVDKEDNFDKNKLMKKYLDDFERVKRQKNLCDGQIKVLSEHENQLISDFHSFFNQDIQIASLKDNKALIAKDNKSKIDNSIYDFFDKGNY